MTMAALVQALQALFGLVWLIPLGMLWPSLWRVLRGRADLLDLVRAPHWFAALVMVLGATRWLVFPDAMRGMGTPELSFWAGIYVTGICSAVGVTFGTLAGERLR